MSTVVGRAAAAANRVAVPKPALAPESGELRSITITPAVSTLLFAATALVIGLGVFREIILSLAGTETVLQDLRHFNLDAERNLGSWYSSVLMIVIALCAYVASSASTSERGPGRANWLLIAVVFVLMSIDETVGFHETVDAPLRTRFGLAGVLYNPWILFGALFVVVFALRMVPFLMRLPGGVRLIFLLGGAVYVGGALGLEPVDALLEDRYGEGHVLQRISTTVEETMEMLGLCIFLGGILKYLGMTRMTLRWGR